MANETNASFIGNFLTEAGRGLGNFLLSIAEPLGLLILVVAIAGAIGYVIYQIGVLIVEHTRGGGKKRK